MAIETIYNFTISTDTLNGSVIPDLLLSEINAPDSGIYIQCKSVTTDEDNMSVTMKDVMPDHTNGTSASLTSIVSTHDGTNTNAANIIQAQLVHEDGGLVSTANPLEINEAANPRDIWKKVMFHDTVRPPDCDTYYTSKGDKKTPRETGTGNKLFWQHVTGDATPNPIYVDFNMETNKTHLHNGWIYWMGGKGDEISAEVVPEVTTVGTGANTDFSLYNGYLVMPAAAVEGAGAGTCTVDGNTNIPATSSTFKFVQCITSQKTGIKSAGYWDAEWDDTNKYWTNITPNYSGTGNYNLFSIEIIFDRFTNHILMIGDNSLFLNSRDTAQLGIGMRLKFHIDIVGSDHDLTVGINLYMHRQSTL